MKKINNILIDFKDMGTPLNNLPHVGEILYNIALYLNKIKNIEIFFCNKIMGNISFQDFAKQKGEFDFKIIDIEKKDKNIEHKLSDINCYLGFESKGDKYKRDYFNFYNRPVVIYAEGFFPSSMMVGRRDLFGDGVNARILSHYCSHREISNEVNEYKKYAINNNISKRPQKGSDPIPDVPFIFIPGQALKDISIVLHSPVNFLEFIYRVTNFAKEKGIYVVFKHHPSLYLLAHGKQEQIDFLKIIQTRYKNLFVVNNSIFDICKKSLFMATLNSACVFDAFLCNTPVYCCGRSLFCRTKAVVYNPNIEEGLETIFNQSYDKNRMFENQNKCILWAIENLVKRNDSPEKSSKIIEYQMGVKF